MDKQQALRETVARFLQVEPASLAPDFALRGPRMEGSVARYALDAAIRRAVGAKCRAVYTAKTYGVLEAAVLGKETPDQGDVSTTEAPLMSARSVGDGNAVSCGVDMELVANMPEADDYWSHEFYHAHFTKAEIAYCLTKEQPRMHFAARWCAKEALKKCDPAFLQADMNRIEVAREDDGRLKLQVRRDDAAVELPYALSLSHTPDAAVAVVVRVNAHALQGMEREALPGTPPVPIQPATSAGATRSARLSLIAALAALVLAMAALIVAL